MKAGTRHSVHLGTALALLLVLTARPESKTKKVPKNPVSEEVRFAMIQRAQIWSPVTVSKMDIRLGPQDKGAFEPNAKVRCDYVEGQLDGATPKFDCRLDDGSVVKVKYGLRGEIEGEVLATRLLWALGFGADRMYPAVVTCRGCAADPWTTRQRVAETHMFDPAVIERKASGHAIATQKIKGWAWPELNKVDRTQGGAPIEQREALQLLAVFIQHSDSKPEQQRLACLSHDSVDDEGNRTGECARPFMLLNDLGQTFGKANFLNRDNVSSVNFDGWSKTGVWKDKKSCIGNISLSRTGTLEHPKISEAGRAFLAGLLVQLTDRQLHDLFDVARVELRSRKPGSGERPATVDEWVAAFKQKRDEIVNRRCDDLTSRHASH
jgi:hypothetical protein